MKVLFLHGWHSIPGGVKPTFLARHGHDVLNPALPDEDFEEAVRVAQREFDTHRPDVIVGSSRGGAVAMSIDSGDTPLVLLCPAWKRWGTARVVKRNTTVLHSRADDVIPFEGSEELVRISGLSCSALVEVGSDHRLADPDSLTKMLAACESYCPSMLVIGSDFTSDPRPGKPITVAFCRAHDTTLAVERIERLVNFQSFALLLGLDGPWIAGIDFPFGQPQQLLDDLQWGPSWEAYVRSVARLGKQEFRAMLNAYRSGQPKGKKEHFRVTDRRAKSISPMKLYGVPVGLMFCEGSPFLLASPASVLPCLPGRDNRRVIVETYPKLVAKKLVGKMSYKTDDDKKVTDEQKVARERIMGAIRDQSATSGIRRHYGFHIECDDGLAQGCVGDPSGDTLDALLCALQTAWAWSKRDEGYGIPPNVNALEGWITDPELLDGRP